MALTPAELEAALDNIDTALGSGELRVQVGDQEVTYRSVWELNAARHQLSQLLAATETGTLSPRYRVANFADD